MGKYQTFNTTIIITKLFGLQELSGFFTAQFILIGLVALIGDFVTAIISWLINHSKTLAIFTFFSALILQFATVAIILPMTIKQSQRSMVLRIKHDNAFQQFATIGNISFEVQEQYSDRDLVIFIQNTASYTKSLK